MYTDAKPAFRVGFQSWISPPCLGKAQGVKLPLMDIDGGVAIFPL